MACGNTYYLEPGTILHTQYRINGIIGQGGFGITYDGTDLKLDMHVAIKEYFPNPMASRQTTVSMDVVCNSNTVDLYERGMKNFLDEARAMAKYAGEDNFVAVHDYFSENNTAYIIMEFVEGENLKQYLRHYKLLPIETVMAIIVPVMNALEKIHSKGMIHRDISPSNIMILPDGRVRLLDFGAVKEISLETGNMTTMSSVFKYGYSPIEQLTQGMKQGPYTDIYALCATMYEMLTGSTPPSPFQRLYEGAALIPPSNLGVRIAPMQERAILKGLEINGADRIQSIRELREMLCGYTGNENGSTVVRNDSIKIVLIAAGTTAAIAVMIILGFLLRNFLPVPKPDETDLALQLSVNTAQEAEEDAEAQANEDYTEEDESGPQSNLAAHKNEETKEIEAEEAGAENGTGVETGAAVVQQAQSEKKQEAADVVYPTEMPDEIYLYNGHSYAFYDAKEHDLATYSAVCNFCREQGGHLAVINDQQENDYLYTLMTQNYDHTVFFGYSDENEEGNWEWDGDSSDYENWTRHGDWDLPDNGREYGGNEDYAEFNYDTIHDWSPRDGTWNDASFMENTTIFLCEWEYEMN